MQGTKLRLRLKNLKANWIYDNKFVVVMYAIFYGIPFVIWRRLIVNKLNRG
jgi:hypothetical protein